MGKNEDHTKITDSNTNSPHTSTTETRLFQEADMLAQNPGYFTILYFASASSYTSKTSELIPAPLPLSQLFRTLEERYGGFRSKVLDSCLVTINLEYVDMPDDATESEVTIAEGDEVAIIPPVSSG